jgi:hypothetical protein
MSVSSPSRFVPSRGALLLMDLQNGALSSIADTAELIDCSGRARAAADAAGLLVDGSCGTHDYRLLVLADCCADPDADVHEILMTKVFPRRADVTDTAGLDALIG